MGESEVEARINAIQREPRAWSDQAEALLEAADLVGPVFQERSNLLLKLFSGGSEIEMRATRLGGPSLLLIGYAIEVLAKGLIVARDPDAATSRWMRSHINAELLEAAGVTLTDGEKALADKLYHYVKWISRYPAPTVSDGTRFDESSRKAGHWMFGPGSVSSDDYRRAHELYDRMREQLDAGAM